MGFALVSYVRNKIELRKSKQLGRARWWAVLENTVHLAGRYVWSVCILRLVLPIVWKHTMGDKWHQVPLDTGDPSCG